MKDLNYYCNEYYNNLKIYREIKDKNKKENILKDLNLLEYLIKDRLETYKKLVINEN